MKKRVLYFGFFIAFSCLFFSGCGNGNIFSWAHDDGTGTYESLMIDAEAAMKDEKYSKAAKYYRSAINKKSGNAAAIQGYSSAFFAAAVGSNHKDIINAVISGRGSASTGLLSFLKIGDAQKIKNALTEILRPDMLPSILESAENKVDVNLNAAIAYLLLAASSILEIADLDINSDFSLKAPDFASAAAEIIAAVNGCIIPNLNNAEQCLDRIVAEGGSVSYQFKNEINKLKQNLAGKGYSI